MRREERVTVQGPVKEQQPDGMSHGEVPPPAPDDEMTITIPQSGCTSAQHALMVTWSSLRT